MLEIMLIEGKGRGLPLTYPQFTLISNNLILIVKWRQDGGYPLLFTILLNNMRILLN